MTDEPASINFEAIELEEARLRERLAKITAFKQLARELNIPLPGAGAAPSIQSQPREARTVTIAGPGADAAPSPPSQSPEAVAVTPEAAPPLSWEIFDGTFAGLIQSYRSHEESPYRRLKHAVRVNYDNSLNRLILEIGHERIATWSAESVQHAHDEMWGANGKIAMGHNMVAKLRLLCTFGSTTLNDDACIRLSAILGNMRFPTPKGRKGGLLTRDQIRAIRVIAREQYGWDSISLAQAFQLEFPKLRMADILGEWVPLSEPGTSEIVKGDEKWLRGLRWSDIDENMVLHRMLTGGRRGQHKEVAYNLKRSAMVIEEINRIPVERRTGPMVVCEYSNLPWSANEFRRKWRMVATKAGVPPSIIFGGQIADDEEAELGAEAAL
jgi:hypothetical protein